MDNKERQELHDALRDDLFKRQLSNSELLDKAILSLSSAGIGVSLVFIKTKGADDTPQILNLQFLHWSWTAFLSAIVITLVSFLISQYAIKKQLKRNRQYYLEYKEDVINQKNHFAWITFLLTHLSVLFYIGAVWFMIKFLKTNILGGQL